MARIRNAILKISEYVPGKTIEDVAQEYGFIPEEVLKLGSNENPLGPSPKAVQAVKDHAHTISVYPPAGAKELRHAMAQYVGYPVNQIVVGNGMDGVLDIFTRLFVEKNDEVIIPIPTFSYYELFTLACGAVPILVPRNSNFDIDVHKLLDAVNERTKLIFLCSPNNPTGNPIQESDLRQILDATEIMVILDEAYVEFADSSMVELVRGYENFIVTRSMSKAFGLAGLRIGYAVVPPEISREYMKVAPVFSVNRIGISAGVAALGDDEHLTQTIKTIRSGRDSLQNNIPFKVYPSQANFVLVDVSPFTSEEICESLLRKGIIVRDCRSFRGAGDSLIRVSVGTKEQNKRVIEAFKGVRT
ncbi:MAG TPA: histidinol-phosphate transaminase [Methanocellales archaeon]|nr:histidinol-phosphate transaminase [Methanocellales archaeon]